MFEHIELIRQGVTVWNTWREKYPNIQPDTSGISMKEADLRGFNLRGVNLSNAYLRFADLSSVDLSGANLSGTNLFDADLRRANLSGANLYGATLGANLSEANLSKANLYRADLRWAGLKGTDFSTTRFNDVILAQVDLCNVQGLDTVIHEGPSLIDVKTVKLPQGKTRVHFLRGVGFSDTFIDYYDSLFTSALQYESCFISYAHEDKAVAERLYKDLQDKGVRCWFAPEDLKIGDHYHQRIDESIRLYDKLILILSADAVQSTWVEREVVAAREKEERQHKAVLFPIRLDDAVMDTTRAWAADVRRRWHIGDFTQWKNYDAYQIALSRLLHDLKAQS